MSARRAVVAVAGDAGVTPASAQYRLAEEIGRRLVEAGFRVLTGGLGGVMEAASKGARVAANYRDGDVIALLPGRAPSDANEYVDVVIPTGLDHARNVIVAMSDALIAIGGGAGTLSEMAHAWMEKRLIVALRVEGWSGRLADQRIDGRTRYADVPDDRVYGANSASDAVEVVTRLLSLYDTRHHGIAPQRIGPKSMIPSALKLRYADETVREVVEGLFARGATWSYVANRTSKALEILHRDHEEWLSFKLNVLAREKNERNARALLGELRAVAELVTLWGDRVTPTRRSKGADCFVNWGTKGIHVEIATVLGGTERTEVAGETKELRVGATTIKVETSFRYPFGAPDGERRPQDRIQGNAVSRLAGVKQSERQVPADSTALLWLDFLDHLSWRLAFSASAVRPLSLDNSGIVSGPLWWAWYGRKGDYVFDRLSLEFSDHSAYPMEFDGRFASSRFIAVISDSEGWQAILQHPQKRIPPNLMRRLLSLRAIDLDGCWIGYPFDGGIVGRTRSARQRAMRMWTQRLR